MSRWLERSTARVRRALGVRPRRLLHVDDAALGLATAGAPPDWHAALLPLFAALAPREEVDVVVADSWCRFWLTAADSTAEVLPGLRSAAAARAQVLYELNSADWVIEADWRFDQPFLCCALPQDLLAALRAVAEARRVHVRRVQPQAVHALQEAPVAAPDPDAPLWLCSVSPRTVLSLVVEQGHLRHVRHSWLGAPGDDELPAGLLREQATQLGLPEPVHMRRLGHVGQGEGEGADAGRSVAMKPPRIDFSLAPLPGEGPPRRALRPLERSLLATALALLAGAWAAGQALDTVPDTPASEDALSAEVATAPTDGIEPLAAPAAPDALREARELAHFPWMGVLEALEGALLAGVEVSTLELRATDARLKLGLRAEGADQALAMAQRLARHPGLAALRITQQDWVGAGTDAAALQVSLEGPLPAAPWRRGDAASLGRPGP